ncbi:MAG: cell division protein FtsQ/DivIB [Candidatus Nealsonbacteria bacterium]
MRKYRKPHRIKKKQPFFKKKYFWSTFFVFVFSVLVVYLLVFSSFFQVENIIISGNEKVSKQEIVKVIERELAEKKLFFLEKNIFLADLNKTKEDILNEFSKVGKVRLKQVLPDTIDCIVEERVEVATFCKDYESDNEEIRLIREECFLLDREGIVFEMVLDNNFQLPKIKSPDSENKSAIGEKVIETDLVSKILEIFSELENSDILIGDILIVSEERINVRVLDGFEIYFNPKKDLYWQFTKLKAVLEKYIPLDKRKDLEYIDLRFGNLAPFKYIEKEE